MIKGFANVTIKLYEIPLLGIEMRNNAHNKAEENILWERKSEYKPDLTRS